jgi:hypothetical protein
MQTRKAIIILQSEVGKGIKEIREKKAARNDDIPVRYTQSDVRDGLRMTQLINNSHENGQWPKDSTEVTVTASKKKQKLQNAATSAQSASWYSKGSSEGSLKNVGKKKLRLYL